MDFHTFLANTGRQNFSQCSLEEYSANYGGRFVKERREVEATYSNKQGTPFTAERQGMLWLRMGFLKTCFKHKLRKYIKTRITIPQ
jgi:hypothetical protein